MNKPAAEELSLRIRPVRHRWRLLSTWLGSRAAVLLVLSLAAALLGGMYLVLRDTGSFSRRRIEFPPLPQLDAAIASAQERLKVNPQDIAALVELGTLHFEKGREYYPDAINELEEARDLGALDPRIFYCLGLMYQEVGLYPFALQEYKRFLRHYPEDKEVRLLAAKLLYKQGSYAESVSEYERLKFRDPNDPIIEENLALSLWGAKAVDRALESFSVLASRGGDTAKRAEFYIGQIVADRGDANAALIHFLKCVPAEGEPDFGIPPAAFYSALAATQQKLGQLPEAKSAWEKVLAAAPGDSKAQGALKDVNRRLSAARRASSAKRK